MKKLTPILISIFLIGCTSSNPITMNLSSPAFENAGNIPSKYTCDGDNISPELNWSEVPEGTESFVLIHDDPDAVPVAGYVWDHWILYNIPANTSSIPENSSVGQQGMTSFGKTGYGGPCPPDSSGKHKYFFKLYALDSSLDLPAEPDKSQIEEAMEGHILAQAELTGNYDRTK